MRSEWRSCRPTIRVGVTSRTSTSDATVGRGARLSGSGASCVATRVEGRRVAVRVERREHREDHLAVLHRPHVARRERAAVAVAVDLEDHRPVDHAPGAGSSRGTSAGADRRRRSRPRRAAPAPRPDRRRARTGPARRARSRPRNRSRSSRSSSSSSASVLGVTPAPVPTRRPPVPRAPTYGMSARPDPCRPLRIRWRAGRRRPRRSAAGSGARLLTRLTESEMPSRRSTIFGAISCGSPTTAMVSISSSSIETRHLVPPVLAGQALELGVQVAVAVELEHRQVRGRRAVERELRADRLPAALELRLVAAGHHDRHAHDLDVARRRVRRGARRRRWPGSVSSSSERREFTGCTRKPSATSPATAVILGPNPAVRIARRAERVRPGIERRDHARVRVEVAREPQRGAVLPRSPDRADPGDELAHARRPGRDHGIENRCSMCGRICEPSPSTKRPPVTVCRSHAVLASVIGVRAKRDRDRGAELDRRVCSPATASGMNGSCLASNENARS